MTGEDLSLKQRKARVQQFSDAGLTLASEGNEWGAVSLFYATYHQVRVALMEDPVFDDLSKLQRVNPYLQMSDRHAEHHQGNPARGARSYGVRDLVRVLYTPWYGRYHRLHSASIEVRYEAGLRQIELHELIEDASAIMEAYQSGLLAHEAATSR